MKSTIVEALLLAEKAIVEGECKRVHVIVMGSFYMM